MFTSNVLLQISAMLLFVKHYKKEVLGVGEVALAGEGGALREAANQRATKEAKDHSDKKDAAEHQDNSSVSDTTNGDGSSTAEHVRVKYL